MKFFDFKEFTADDFRQCHPKLQFLKPCGCVGCFVSNMKTRNRGASLDLIIFI
jgi:hypothetical protein